MKLQKINLYLPIRIYVVLMNAEEGKKGGVSVKITQKV